MFIWYALYLSVLFSLNYFLHHQSSSIYLLTYLLIYLFDVYFHWRKSEYMIKSLIPGCFNELTFPLPPGHLLFALYYYITTIILYIIIILYNYVIIYCYMKGRTCEPRSVGVHFPDGFVSQVCLYDACSQPAKRHCILHGCAESERHGKCWIIFTWTCLGTRHILWVK